jgi:hypothetical protein
MPPARKQEARTRREAGFSFPEQAMSQMRAKMQVGHVQVFQDKEGNTTQENLHMHCVAKSKYDDSGLDEDNTFAKFSPGGQLNINVANPALFGQFKHGDKFYVDFTPAD